MAFNRSPIRVFKDFYEGTARRDGPGLSFTSVGLLMLFGWLYLALRLADGKLWKHFKKAYQENELGGFEGWTGRIIGIAVCSTYPILTIVGFTTQIMGVLGTVDFALSIIIFLGSMFPLV